MVLNKIGLRGNVILIILVEVLIELFEVGGRNEGLNFI